MAQHDYTIANQGFPATRADINNALLAISSNNSGTSAPSTLYAGQFWIDTSATTWVLYIHDGSDNIQFAQIDTSANTVNFIDSALASDVVISTTGAVSTTGAFTANGTIKLDGNYPTGTDNVALGDTALDSVQAGGINNVAIGDHAGTAITTGDHNIAVGKDAVL